MAIVKWAWCIFDGTVMGEAYEPMLVYFSEDTFTGNGSGAIADLFVSQLWGAMKPLVSNRFRMNSITCYQGTIGSLVTYTTTRYVDEVGDVTTSECLPSFVSAKMIKVPDNDNAVPNPVSPPFRNGLFGVAGIPEEQVDGNLLTDAALGDWDTAFEDFEEVVPTIGGSPKTFRLGMQRFELGGVPVSTQTYTTVLEVSARQSIGTNNSRKKTS